MVPGPLRRFKPCTRTVQVGANGVGEGVRVGVRVAVGADVEVGGTGVRVYVRVGVGVAVDAGGLAGDKGVWLGIAVAAGDVLIVTVEAIYTVNNCTLNTLPSGWVQLGGTGWDGAKRPPSVQGVSGKPSIWVFA